MYAVDVDEHVVALGSQENARALYHHRTALSALRVRDTA